MGRATGVGGGSQSPCICGHLYQLVPAEPVVVVVVVVNAGGKTRDTELDTDAV
jgi:hypothetical protein